MNNFTKGLPAITNGTIIGVGTDATVFAFDPRYNYSFQGVTIITTADGIIRTPVAGDDVTVSKSVGGSAFVAFASAIVLQLDENNIESTSELALQAQFVAAGVASTETWSVAFMAVAKA